MSVEAPVIGEISKGSELGRLMKNAKFIRAACQDCGKERWTGLRDIKLNGGKPGSTLCGSCSQRRRVEKEDRTESSNANWKGGRHIANQYVFVRIRSDNPYFPMAGGARHGAYIQEHRLLMAQELGRCLQPNELVHHKNGIRDDNRLENLQIIVRNGHRNGFHGGNVVCPYCCKEFRLP